MYKYNRGLYEWHLDIESFKKELMIKCKKFNIYYPIRFYSQQDEDKYIIQYILKDKIEDGIYLEIGAMDGVEYSNTKTLEDYFNFTGILIEPQKKYFDLLVKNRPKSKCYNFAVTNKDDDFIEFIGNNGVSGAIHTMTDDFYNKYHKTNQTYQVKNKKMDEIIKESKFEYIDIMSIDVEGGELELLKSIDFSFPIYCIIIEAHSDEQDKNKIFGNYLKKHGFTFKERQRGNEIWINHNYFRKHLFNS